MTHPQSPMITLDKEEASALVEILEHYQDNLWDVLAEDPKLKATVERLETKAQALHRWHKENKEES